MNDDLDKITRQILSQQDCVALRSLAAIYGTEKTDDIIGNLHWLATRLAIASGVEPETFASNVKTCWDTCAEAVNRGEG